MVVQSEIGDASQVKAHGDGLVQGTTFNNASFVVDTREAGQYAVLQLAPSSGQSLNLSNTFFLKTKYMQN